MRRGYGLAFILLVGLTGCARQSAKPQAERIAILRFENLGQDFSADWIGRAIPVILEAELAPAPNTTVVGTGQMHGFDRTLGVRPISAPGISAERTQALVAGANRIVYGDYSVRGGRLYARLWLEDPQTQKIVKVLAATAAANDAIGAATTLARQLSTRLAAYSTRNAECIRAYAEGLESFDPALQVVVHMQEAIAADPDFGPAYRSLHELDMLASPELRRGVCAGAEPRRLAWRTSVAAWSSGLVEFNSTPLASRDDLPLTRQQRRSAELCFGWSRGMRARGKRSARQPWRGRILTWRLGPTAMRSTSSPRTSLCSQ